MHIASAAAKLKPPTKTANWASRVRSAGDSSPQLHEVPETWRAPQLADRSRPIITTCILGPLGALGGKLLHDMGYQNVQILDGGVQAWIEAGLPVVKNGSGRQ